MNDKSPNCVAGVGDKPEDSQDVPAQESLVLKSEDVTIADIDSLITKFPNIRAILAEIVLSRLVVEARSERDEAMAEVDELKKTRAQRRRTPAESQ